MLRHFSSLSFVIIVGFFYSSNADARLRSRQDLNDTVPIAAGLPTLAPFQHVRFCLRYPSECKSDPAESEQIELDADVLELLNRVNHSVNLSIIPTSKSYGENLQDGWTIAPETGDCNDYAVTKRHELRESGLPLRALRLSVVKTASGIGHLVLVVVTKKGGIVMDNLVEEIRPWQTTGYHWLKIQSASDSKLWYEMRAPGPLATSQSESKIFLAHR